MTSTITINFPSILYYTGILHGFEGEIQEYLLLDDR